MRPAYTVVFHTFNDPSTGVGWWLRSVRNGDRQERWVVRCAPSESPPVTAAREPGPLDLAMPPRAVRMIPRALRLFGVRSRYDCAIVERPAETVRVGGREFSLPAAPACAGLVEGTGAATAYAWAHCHAFHLSSEAFSKDAAHRATAKEEGASAWLEAVSGRGLTSIYARHGRREFRMNTLLALPRNRTLRPPSPQGWRFAATTHNRELVCDVRSSPSIMGCFALARAGGAKLYCCATEVASMRLELRARSTLGFPWRTLAVLESEGTTHFEATSLEPAPGVPLLLAE